MESEIFALLCDHLEGLTITPSLDVAMPNVKFPTSGSTPNNYLRVTHLINQREGFSVGDEGTKHLGIFQVSVYWRAGDGIVSALEVADQIAEGFAKGTKLYGTGYSVVIYDPPTVEAPLQEPDRVVVPVSIRYHSIN